MSTEVEWHYIESGKQIEPVLESAVAELIQRGDIKRDTYVWKEGMQDWTEAYMSELARYFVAQSPGGNAYSESTFDDLSSRVKDFMDSGGDLRRKFSWWFNAFWICEGASFVLSFTGIAGAVVSIISLLFSLLIIYNSWVVVQSPRQKFSPLVTTLLSLIPIFNLYWNFVCYYGLTKEINRELDRRGIVGNRVSEGLGLAYAISAILLVLGVMGFMFYFTIGVITGTVIVFIIKLLLLKSIIEGVNRLL